MFKHLKLLSGEKNEGIVNTNIAKHIYGLAMQRVFLDKDRHKWHCFFRIQKVITVSKLGKER